jgi:hypothetical protein
VAPRHLIVVLLVLAASAASGGCGPRLPTPEATHHRGDPFVRVPYPPPVARVELVPPQPSDDAVWVDGFHRFVGGDYRWTPGDWVVPARGMKYAPPMTVRLDDGSLVYYEGKWRQVSD